MTSTWRDKHVS